MEYRWQSALAETIGAIGTDRFTASAAGAFRRAAGFDLAAVVLHRGEETAELLFDDFGPAGHADGIGNYVRVTHRMNPMLTPTPKHGALRASDFVLRPVAATDLSRHLVWSADEEMGFRTRGWPARCEEVGLYLASRDATIELSLYRPRGRYSLPTHDLHALSDMVTPLAAAFDRHAALIKPRCTGVPLSAREAEVHALMIAGCSSEAIALRLGISRHTVKDHRKRIFRKLQVGSLAELFARDGQLG